MACGFAISFTRAMATAYSTSPMTKPTRFFDGSCRWRWIMCDLPGSWRLQDGAQVEQDEEDPLARGGTSDARDVHRLLRSEDAGGLDLVGRQAPDLPDL